MNGRRSRRVHDDDGGSSPSFASSPQLTEDTGATLAEPSSREENKSNSARTSCGGSPGCRCGWSEMSRSGPGWVISGGGWSPMTQSGLDAESRTAKLKV